MKLYEDYQEYRDKVESNQQLKNTIEDLEHDINELRDDLTIHISKNKALSKEVNDLIDENTDLKLTIQSLKEERENDKDEFQNLTDQIEDLEEQLEETESHPYRFKVQNLTDELKVELLQRLYKNYNLEQLQYTENLLGIHDFNYHFKK